MTKINPTNVNATLKTAVKDGLVTEGEAGKLSPAVVRDLVKSDDPKKTLKLAAENLKKFLEPFRTNDSQEEGGVRLARETRYSLADLADKLGEAAEKLDAMKSGIFAVAMGLHFDDGQLNVREAKQLESVAKKVVEGAADPAEAARTMRTTLIEIENVFAQTAAFGMGPTRDEAITASASKALDKLNRFLGVAIAKGLEGTSPSEAVDPDGAFAKQMAEIVGTPGWERRILLESLPRLVDQEVAMFDSTGLQGAAKLRMDQQADARAKALLAYTNGLTGDDLDDVKNALYRIVTGRFAPESMMNEFLDQLKTLPVDELEGGAKAFRDRIAELASGNSFSVKNERKGLEEGVALVEAELARRS